MPLTTKEKKVKAAMAKSYKKKGYGKKRIESIFYAWENKHRGK